MKVHQASRRAIDCYVALMEGFYVVDTPYGPVMAPEGLAGDGWEWRSDIKFASFVPSFTREPSSGLAVLSKHGFTLKSNDPDALEACIAEMIRASFGDDLPPIRGMPASMKRKKKRKRS